MVSAIVARFALRVGWECGKSPEMRNPNMRKGPPRYYARLDAKQRLTLRGAKFNQFAMTARADGSFVAKPVVTVPASAVLSKAERKAWLAKLVKGKVPAKAAKLIEFRQPTKRERAFGKSLEPLARKVLKRAAVA
jgi:hypothetical protein